jgi:GNAT superfamily N-acetyltransferase
MIRSARSHVVRLLSELAFRSKAAWGYSKEFMEACRDELTVTADEIAAARVLEIGDEVVGFYALREIEADAGAGGVERVNDSKSAELEYLFVQPAAFRRGHGREMFEHAVDDARARGFRRVVIQGDPNAAAFYRQVGAEQVRERPSASVPGRVLPLFELAL